MVDFVEEGCGFIYSRLAVIRLVAFQPAIGAVNTSARVVNDRWYLDVDGHSIVVGEVENAGDVALKDVEMSLSVRSKFFDKVDEDTWTVRIWFPKVLEPGFKAPFRELVPVFGDFLSYEIKGVSFTIWESKHKLEVLTMETYEDEAGCLHINIMIRVTAHKELP